MKRSRQEMQRFNAVACTEALTSLARTITATFRASYGPNGRFLLSMAGAHAHATSQSEQIFRCPLHLRESCESYFYAVLTQVLAAQREAFGDGTKFVAGFAAHLLAAALASDAPATEVASAFGLGLQWVLGALDRKGKGEVDIGLEEIRFSELDRVVGFVESLLSTKRLCRMEMGMESTRIAKVVVQAFVWGLKETEVGNGMVGVEGSVKIVEMVGEEMTECRVRRGEVVLDVEVPASPFDLGCFQGRKLHVVVYDVDLMLGNTEGIRVDAAVLDREWTAGEAEMRMLEDLCDALKRRGVDVVACQKRVHAYAKVLLLSKGIFVLERLGRDSTRAIQDISGGRIISCCEAPQKQDLGEVESIVLSRVMLDKYYVVIRNGQRNSATLVLCAPHPVVMVELRAAVECAFVALRCFLRDPTLVPGAGAVDTRLAHTVRCKLERWKTEHPESIGTFRLVQGFALALEDTAAALNKSFKVSRTDVIESMSRGCWRAPFVAGGTDVEIMDLRAVKAAALRAGVQLATTLYNIGGVILDTR